MITVLFEMQIVSSISVVFQEDMRRRYNQRRFSIVTHLRALPVQCALQPLRFTLLQGMPGNRTFLFL